MVVLVAQAEHKSKFIDLRGRRSVHIAIKSETHKEIRKALVERDLSMQELFQRFSELVVSGDKRATKIVEELERDKRAGNIKRLSPAIDKRNAGTIYDLIAEESAIENKSNLEEDDDD